MEAGLAGMLLHTNIQYLVYNEKMLRKSFLSGFYRLCVLSKRIKTPTIHFFNETLI